MAATLQQQNNSRDLGRSTLAAATQLVPVGFKFALYPVERLRIALQTKHFASHGGQTVNQIFGAVRLNSLPELWRGFGTTILRWFIYQQLNLYFKDKFSDIFPKVTKDDGYAYYAVSKVGAGAAAGLAAAAVWGYPLDVVRQELATTTRQGRGSAADTVRAIYAERGLRGFYRGYLMDAPGLMIFRGVQLGGWDMVKESYGKEAWEKRTLAGRFLTAQVVSLSASIMSYPCDTWRRNLIRAKEGMSYGDILRLGKQQVGGGSFSTLRFLYSGFSVRVLSSVVNAALLESWDEWKRRA